MGSGNKKNASRDVMQCLFPGDYGLWIMCNIDPNIEKMWHVKSVGDNRVWVVDINENGEREYKEASCVRDFHYTETLTSDCGFGDGFGFLQNMFTNIEEDDIELEAKLGSYEGEYLIHYDAVTPNLSIACGIGYL